MAELPDPQEGLETDELVTWAESVGQKLFEIHVEENNSLGEPDEEWSKVYDEHEKEIHEKVSKVDEDKSFQEVLISSIAFSFMDEVESY